MKDIYASDPKRQSEMSKKAVKSTQYAFFLGAAIVALLAVGQAWLYSALKDGTPWGPTPEWLVFGPMLSWIFIDAACLLWLILIACKKARYHHSVVLITAAAVVGTYFAWSTTVGFLRAV